ncbi:hypothetical protein NSA56_01925 [Oceanobacillus caeni]|uniref:hypothetical protein n=1 Tax=Oceanobacillus caeni TaxID=405946 RepID=UPI002149EABF|nr:hypothetical protein [Oceanobacillus caeni]MCR1833155.1 hypothetical protein [Oceanobacillus caeni]
MNYIVHKSEDISIIINNVYEVRVDDNEVSFLDVNSSILGGFNLDKIIGFHVYEDKVSGSFEYDFIK